MRTRGATATVVATVAVAAALAACSRSAARDLDAVAAAKCFLPVAQRLQPDIDASASHDVQHTPGTPTDVRRLPNGRREVTGTVTYGGGRHAYTCLVAPDGRDKLRHLRVVRLTVT